METYRNNHMTIRSPSPAPRLEFWIAVQLKRARRISDLLILEKHRLSRIFTCVLSGKQSTAWIRSRILAAKVSTVQNFQQLNGFDVFHYTVNNAK